MLPSFLYNLKFELFLSFFTLFEYYEYLSSGRGLTLYVFKDLIV